MSFLQLVREARLLFWVAVCVCRWLCVGKLTAACCLLAACSPALCASYFCFSHAHVQRDHRCTTLDYWKPMFISCSLLASACLQCDHPHRCTHSGPGTGWRLPQGPGGGDLRPRCELRLLYVGEAGECIGLNSWVANEWWRCAPPGLFRMAETKWRWDLGKSNKPGDRFSGWFSMKCWPTDPNSAALFGCWAAGPGHGMAQILIPAPLLCSLPASRREQRQDDAGAARDGRGAESGGLRGTH